MTTEPGRDAMSDKETAPPCRPYMGRLLKKLADPSEAFHYINAAWQESPEVFVQAVKDVAQAVAVEFTVCGSPPQPDWKKEALALVVLLRAKCSDEEWANMESRFEAAPAPQPAINRFELIDWTANGRFGCGRVTTIWEKPEEISIRHQLQDGGRTLKVFVSDGAAATPQVTPTKENK